LIIIAIETFKLDSWLEHLRQHERVTLADREQQELVHRFQLEGKPKVSHFIAACQLKRRPRPNLRSLRTPAVKLMALMPVAAGRVLDRDLATI